MTPATAIDDATALSLGEIRNDSAWVGRDEDWYRIDVPADVGYLTVQPDWQPGR